MKKVFIVKKQLLHVAIGILALTIGSETAVAKIEDFTCVPDAEPAEFLVEPLDEDEVLRFAAANGIAIHYPDHVSLGTDGKPLAGGTYVELKPNLVALQRPGFDSQADGIRMISWGPVRERMGTGHTLRKTDPVFRVYYRDGESSLLVAGEVLDGSYPVFINLRTDYLFLSKSPAQTLMIVYRPLAQLIPCDDDSVDLRTVEPGFRCRTSKGAIFERVASDNSRGESWKGPGGKVYGDLMGEYSHDGALRVCKSFDGRLPTLNELELAEYDGLREVLPNMEGRWYWSATTYSREHDMDARNQSYLVRRIRNLGPWGFSGSSGEIGRGRGSAAKSSVRCIWP